MEIVSRVYGQSELRQHEVLLTQKIDHSQQEKAPLMKAFCFLRPTATNFKILCKEVADPRFAEYYLCMSIRYRVTRHLPSCS